MSSPWAALNPTEKINKIIFNCILRCQLKLIEKMSKASLYKNFWKISWFNPWNSWNSSNFTSERRIFTFWSLPWNTFTLQQSRKFIFLRNTQNSNKTNLSATIQNIKSHFSSSNLPKMSSCQPQKPQIKKIGNRISSGLHLYP